MPSQMYIQCRRTYYSGSLTNSKALKTSCSTGFGIKLFPSGSYDLNTRRAISLGVSFDTKFFSKLKSTGDGKAKFDMKRRNHAKILFSEIS